ncbi:MAG TPA: hypothetical protein VMY37_38935 [Thermoguttaceae bacterium]|nr:hypothetical protein [Thermoguttaceae bacterium]
MRRLLDISLGVCVVLALASGEAFARGGGRMGGSQGGMRGGFGAQQSAAAYQFGAMQQHQYRMQARARAMQSPYGNYLGYGQQQVPYGVAPGQLPLNNPLGAMQQQRMQNRVRAGQGGFGGQGGTVQPFQFQNGLGTGQCPFGNQPQALQQQRRQGRAQGAQNAQATQRGGAQQRSRSRTRVPQ